MPRSARTWPRPAGASSSTTSTRSPAARGSSSRPSEWLVVVPFWAAWPFETLVIPKRPAARLTELDECARDDLATVLPDLLGRYDGLFKRAVPVFDGLAPGAV